MELSNVTLLELLPPNLARDPNVKAMAQAFDMALREIIVKIPEIEIIPNLVGKKIVDETLLDLLAWQFHADFYDPGLPIPAKQELVLKALDWHFRKGTPSVVEEIITAVFSDAEIKEWFQYEGLPYRFRITTEKPLPDQETFEKFIRAVKSGKNTRSLLDAIEVIRQEYANVFCGSVIKAVGQIHCPATENDANAILAAVPVIKKSVNILASENEANVFGIMAPELCGKINFLASENDAMACIAVVPQIKCSVKIFAGEVL